MHGGDRIGARAIHRDHDGALRARYAERYEFRRAGDVQRPLEDEDVWFPSSIQAS